MSTLRVLIVGGGAIAGGYDAALPDAAWPRTHAAAYRRAGGFDLAAVVEPDPVRRQAFMDRWGVRHGHATLGEATTSMPFDVISICSPTACHAPDLKAAIAMRPRLIFCEKPVTTSLDLTRALVAEAAEAGIDLAVNHTRRWAPDMVALAGQLASGALGKVHSVQAVYTKGILNNGSHLFDLLNMLFGGVRVLATGRARVDHAEADPTIPFLAETPTGIPICVAIGDARDFALFEITIITQTGVVQIEDGGTNWRIRTVVDSPDFAGYRALDRGETRHGRYEEAMTAAVTQIRNRLLSAGALASTGETAAAAQSLSETTLLLSRHDKPGTH